MSLTSIRNDTFRDAVRNANFPFTEDSTLDNADLYFGTALVIDAVIYIRGAYTLPFSITEVQGTGDTLRVQISAPEGPVCTGTLSYAALEGVSGDVRMHLYDEYGEHAGLVLFEGEELERFAGRVKDTGASISAGTAMFVPGVCKVLKLRGITAIGVNGVQLGKEVILNAGPGLRFRYTGGVVYLDLLGSTPAESTAAPVTSINGVETPSIWIGCHPQSNLRVDSTKGSLRFTTVRGAK